MNCEFRLLGWHVVGGSHSPIEEKLGEKSGCSLLERAGKENPDSSDFPLTLGDLLS